MEPQVIAKPHPIKEINADSQASTADALVQCMQGVQLELTEIGYKVSACAVATAIEHMRTEIRTRSKIKA